MAPDLRAVALGDEVLTSIRLIEHGLAAVQRLGAANDFYYAPLLLLSTGLERLMKCVVCLRALEAGGQYPTRSKLKRFSHDLAALRDAVVRSCFDDAYCSRQAAAADAGYLTDDARGRRFLEMLSTFAQAARYHNLDTVCGEAPDVATPDHAWAALEMEILKDYPDLLASLRSGGPLGEVYSRINTELVGHVERTARALCRLFTLGPLGERGQMLTGYIGPFLFLQDRDLGTRAYPLRSPSR